MRVVIATHGNCMDGLASSALFAHLIRHVEPGASEFEYRTCIYGPTPVAFGPEFLDGHINAILDYRFYSGPELSWYFDHHATAFSSAEDRDRFKARVGSGQFHFDSTSASCAGLIGRVARQQFGLPLGHLEPLVEFADSVDSARYGSAREALDRSSARSRFLAVVERYGNDEFFRNIAARLLETPLDQVVELPEISMAYAAIAREQQEFLDHVQRCSEDRGAVVVTDITDREHPTFAKFANYLLFPESTYSVLLGRIPGALKISVGFNPWGPKPRSHDLGSICSRFGGGGHLVVGGVSFASEDVSAARAVLSKIVDLLEAH
jgi:hypothetical protein